MDQIKQQTENIKKLQLFLFVGDTGFEPAAYRTPCVRASQLRQSPEFELNYSNIFIKIYLI